MRITVRTSIWLNLTQLSQLIQVSVSCSLFTGTYYLTISFLDFLSYFQILPMVLTVAVSFQYVDATFISQSWTSHSETWFKCSTARNLRTKIFSKKIFLLNSQCTLIDNSNFDHKELWPMNIRFKLICVSSPGLGSIYSKTGDVFDTV